MEFYRFSPSDENNKDAIVCYAKDDIQTKYGLRDSIIREGHFFEDWDKNFTFEFDSTEGNTPQDFMINDLGWVIVSLQVLGILDGIGVTNIQYLPVLIKEKNSEVILDGFSVLNVTELTDALDLEHSKSHNIGKLIIVSKFALKQDAIEGKHVLRLKGQNIPVFFSGIVVNALKQNSITGCDFTEVKVV